MGDVSRIGDNNSYVSINAGTAVPAAVRLLRVIDAYCKHVGFREVDVGCEIEAEAGVSVGVCAELVAVQEHGGVLVDTIEFDADSLSFPIRRSAEGFAIPACSAREEPTSGAGGIVLVRGRFDAPVVREIDGAPGSIGK